MAKATYWQRGEALDYTNSGSALIEAGTVILFGSRLGVAACDIPAGGVGSLHVQGVFDIPKGSAAITAGQEVYWDNTNSCIKAAGDSTGVNGYAVAAAGADDTTVLVKINA